MERWTHFTLRNNQQTGEHDDPAMQATRRGNVRAVGKRRDVEVAKEDGSIGLMNHFIL
jgi:hypothetical protein